MERALTVSQPCRWDLGTFWKLDVVSLNTLYWEHIKEGTWLALLWMEYFCSLQIYMLKSKSLVWQSSVVFGDGALGGNWVVPSYNKRQKRACFPCLLFTCEDTMRRWPAECSSYQTPDLLAHWSWTCQPPELWKIHLCCVSHPVYVILLWQPWLEQTPV